MGCSKTTEQIDALLPQTQCGLCGYGGCLPYAKAMVEESVRIDLCPPGGVPVLQALGNALEVDASPYLDEMITKAKPKLKAVIREADCIGCAKCIKACPVDAIVGTGKHMHTVIPEWCTGCELCVAPCPVDCIDLVEIAREAADIEKMVANEAREHFQARNARLAASHAEDHRTHTTRLSPLGMSESDKLHYIKAARERMLRNS